MSRTEPSRETLLAVVLTALLVVSGLLSWENLTLKSRLAAAGGETFAREIGPGDRLRPMEVVSLSGARRTLFTGDGSAPALLLFFSTSCPHCENAAGGWNRLAAVAGRRRIEVLGISLDDAGPSGEFVERHRLRFPVTMLVDAGYPDEHRIYGVPVAILADTGGLVLGVWPGEVAPEAFVDIANRAGSFPGGRGE